jgi:NAD(P)H-dependent flavin oxidoreductase YrpB (nitropropane dioxygenase family)
MATILHRPVCDLLGCPYPIVLAGMRGVARSEIVAAVTKAGGFGFLGLVLEPVMLIRSEAEALRARDVQRFADLAAMLASRESNIELVTVQLPTTPLARAPHER